MNGGRREGKPIRAAACICILGRREGPRDAPVVVIARHDRRPRRTAAATRRARARGSTGRTRGGPSSSSCSARDASPSLQRRDVPNTAPRILRKVDRIYSDFRSRRLSKKLSHDIGPSKRLGSVHDFHRRHRSTSRRSIDPSPTASAARGHRRTRYLLPLAAATPATTRRARIARHGSRLNRAQQHVRLQGFLPSGGASRDAFSRAASLAASRPASRPASRRRPRRLPWLKSFGVSTSTAARDGATRDDPVTRRRGVRRRQ